MTDINKSQSLESASCNSDLSALTIVLYLCVTVLDISTWRENVWYCK